MSQSSRPRVPQATNDVESPYLPWILEHQEHNNLSQARSAEGDQSSEAARRNERQWPKIVTRRERAMPVIRE